MCGCGCVFRRKDAWSPVLGTEFEGFFYWLAVAWRAVVTVVTLLLVLRYLETPSVSQIKMAKKGRDRVLVALEHGDMDKASLLMAHAQRQLETCFRTWCPQPVLLLAESLKLIACYAGLAPLLVALTGRPLEATRLDIQLRILRAAHDTKERGVIAHACNNIAVLNMCAMYPVKLGPIVANAKFACALSLGSALAPVAPQLAHMFVAVARETAIELDLASTDKAKTDGGSSIAWILDDEAIKYIFSRRGRVLCATNKIFRGGFIGTAFGWHLCNNAFRSFSNADRRLTQTRTLFERVGRCAADLDDERLAWWARAGLVLAQWRGQAWVDGEDLVVGTVALKDGCDEYDCYQRMFYSVLAGAVATTIGDCRMAACSAHVGTAIAVNISNGLAAHMNDSMLVVSPRLICTLALETILDIHYAIWNSIVANPTAPDNRTEDRMKASISSDDVDVGSRETMLRGVSAKMSQVLDRLHSTWGRDANEATALIYEAFLRRTAGAEEMVTHTLLRKAEEMAKAEGRGYYEALAERNVQPLAS